MKTEEVGIIGGKGKMGAAFAEYFRGKGFSVLVSDIKTKKTNIEVAKQSDIVLLSVPISCVSDVIKEVAPVMKKNALLMDITSVKSDPLCAMLTHFSGAVLGAHPVFGPTNFSAGQTVVLCAGRGEIWQKRIEEIFSDFHLVHMSAEEHDRSMALVQGLQHFMEAAYGATLAKIGSPIDALLSVSSPIYRLQMDMVARVLSQDETMYSRIVFGSDYSQKAIFTFLSVSQKMAKGNTDFFEQEFLRGRKYFGDFCQKAQEESDGIINMLPKSESENRQKAGELKRESAEIGTLGPPLTWSDLALNHFFPKKRSQLYPNFSSIFSALQKEEIDFAFLPIENTISGTVSEVWDDIAQGDYFITEAFNFPIAHVLGSTGKENPTQIFGHWAAIAQCRKTLQKHYPLAKFVPVTSNSEAVFRAKSFLHCAAICSDTAANAEKFVILKKNIADQKGNTTRFALVKKKSDAEKTSGEKITSFSFQLEKNLPGTLLSVLQVFRDAKKNIIRLESRPMGNNFSEYAFFTDIAGEFTPILWNKLSAVTKNLKVLGHYSVKK